jgi:anti-anti-sigma factor
MREDERKRPMPLITRKHLSEDYVVAEIDGAIDADNCHLFRDELRGLMDVGHTRIVLDCGSVNFFCSAGIGVLIRFNQHLEQEPDSMLCLCSLNDQVQKVFDVARVSQFFKIYPSRKEALSNMPAKES